LSTNTDKFPIITVKFSTDTYKLSSLGNVATVAYRHNEDAYSCTNLPQCTALKWPHVFLPGESTWVSKKVRFMPNQAILVRDK
jgi:hypothetical protein